ncbi:MAG: DUF3071 domain-containing protein [Cellulomonas sp.]|nr:DUF3071 domain-containing protein [Cellulomonas sp.]
MGELELVGLHEDGEHLVLLGPDGQRFRLRIDESLRAAVRRDRPQLEQLRAERAGTLSPREIQAAIRAGATAAEVARQAGLDVDSVRRYEGPVLAEREFIAEQAKAARVGHETGSPALGDLVADRLAARGIDVATLAWDAARRPSGPWTVLARFMVGADGREARWTYDPASRGLAAQEDEARWLSETELDDPIGRRHLAAVRDVVFDLRAQPDMPEPAGEDPAPAAVDPTAALLDELGSRRGRRQPVELDDDGEEFEGFGPQRAFDLGRLGQRDNEPAGAQGPSDATPGAGHPRPASPVLPTSVVTSSAGPASGVPASNGPASADPASPAAQPVGVHPTGVQPVGTSSTGGGPATGAPPSGPDLLGAPAESGDRARRRGRAKVPSWDEIVFGARPE